MYNRHVAAEPLRKYRASNVVIYNRVSSYFVGRVIVQHFHPQLPHRTITSSNNPFVKQPSRRATLSSSNSFLEKTPSSSVPILSGLLTSARSSAPRRFPRSLAHPRRLHQSSLLLHSRSLLDAPTGLLCRLPTARALCSTPLRRATCTTTATTSVVHTNTSVPE